MSKILVTGASGFIGRSLVARLQTQGWDVIPLNSLAGDIASPDTLAKFRNQSCAHVFHLAGKTGVPDSWINPHAFCQTNVTGTLNVLEFCKETMIPLTFVSAYVYGHPNSLPIGEGSAVRPSNPYAFTKRLAEEACEFYASTFGLQVTTIRPFNAYGIGQAENFLIPAIISQALGFGEEIVVKDLKPKRDYIYLEDLVTGLLATMGKSDEHRIYNIGSGISHSVQEVIDLVQNIAGTQKKIACDQLIRPNELMNVVADISKAGSELGWRPAVTFREGIEIIIRTQREKPLYEST